MWGKQQPSGIIEGWHGDGNFARTTIMYCLWKGGGAYFSPWSGDLQIGGIFRDSVLYLSLTSPRDWNGNLMFDKKRYSEYMHLPLDWPRINQFPEYFTIEKGKSYRIVTEKADNEQIIKGEDLLEGLPIRIKAGKEIRIKINIENQ
jgi:hypothetical protein